jgi:hypothetical protein
MNTRLEKLAEEYSDRANNDCDASLDNQCDIREAAFIAGYKQALEDAAEIVVQVENEQEIHATYSHKAIFDRIKALGASDE